MTDTNGASELSSEIAATCFGVKVPASPFLNETRIRRMNEGRYEGEEIKGALDVVQPGDRVLELGAGLGVVGAVIAKNAQPDAVLSFEANPNLIPHIKELHHLNDLEDMMEVRHQVVTAGPDQPDRVTFHLRTSYLGSSLIQNDRRRSTPVEVETVPYDTVIKTFRPDVLIMDIEGGELELLRHANLRGIRAIVLEFHPDAYGKAGTRECKKILRNSNFIKNEKLSTRFVWTCTRDEVWSHPDSSWPDPTGGWSERVQTCENAIVKPSETSGFISRSGVQTAQGDDVPMAAHWRNKGRTTLPFDPLRNPPKPLPGRWIWGGVLYRNFAHFIAESLGRLWALDVVRGDIDGILFTPRRPGSVLSLKSFQTDIFTAMGVNVPVKVIDAPRQVEELIVPGQGFGLGAIVAGTPLFRQFRENRFAKDIAPEGSEKLYISRSKLSLEKGGLLGEKQIEKHLRAEGYEIFHPQLHSVHTQIARYRAAKQVIASEGSALHMLAFCGLTDQKVAMISRRKSSATKMIARHLTSFTGNTPLVVSCLKSVWEHPDTQRGRLAMGEPEMQKIQKTLFENGFITASTPWPEVDPVSIQAVLDKRFKRAA
ncbi:FkbM family methyltransferase [uncultured Tateyamaria sp.]|uniref:FkbM family methyltransferase n=1 Tax=uncultured Tateyamaria sp. TaxID=455651 RepID=UPI002634149D|nr:FkbM family methyltransferase [uncultured Tateyamaria sp.]